MEHHTWRWRDIAWAFAALLTFIILVPILPLVWLWDNEFYLPQIAAFGRDYYKEVWEGSGNGFNRKKY